MRSLRNILVCALVLLGSVAYLGAASHVMYNMPVEQQQLLCGGCDIDCEVVGNCLNKPSCTTHDECDSEEGNTYCAGDLDDETCTKETKWGFDCVVDDSNICRPLGTATGMCQISAEMCDTEGNAGDCTHMTEARQCHY